MTQMHERCNRRTSFEQGCWRPEIYRPESLVRELDLSKCQQHVRLLRCVAPFAPSQLCIAVRKAFRDRTCCSHPSLTGASPGNWFGQTTQHTDIRKSDKTYLLIVGISRSFVAEAQLEREGKV